MDNSFVIRWSVIRSHLEKQGWTCWLFLFLVPFILQFLSTNSKCEACLKLQSKTLITCQYFLTTFLRPTSFQKYWPWLISVQDKNSLETSQFAVCLLFSRAALIFPAGNLIIITAFINCHSATVLFLTIELNGIAGDFTCPKGEFPCNNLTRCVAQRDQCNGVDDCGNNADEMQCGKPW